MVILDSIDDGSILRARVGKTTICRSFSIFFSPTLSTLHLSDSIPLRHPFLIVSVVVAVVG